MITPDDVRQYKEEETYWLSKYDVSFERKDNSSLVLGKVNLESPDKHGAQRVSDDQFMLVFMGKDVFYLDGTGDVKFNNLEDVIEKEFTNGKE